MPGPWKAGSGEEVSIQAEAATAGETEPPQKPCLVPIPSNPCTSSAASWLLSIPFPLPIPARSPGWPWSHILMQACFCCTEALRWLCLCVGCSVVYVKWVTDLSASLEAAITSQLTLHGINNIAESCRNWMIEQENWASFQFSPGWCSRCVGTVLLPSLLFSATQRSSAGGVSSLVPLSPERAVSTSMMKYTIPPPWSIDGIIQYCHQEGYLHLILFHRLCCRIFQ